jgi:uncharacterized protein (TIGR00251 family)
MTQPTEAVAIWLQPRGSRDQVVGLRDDATPGQPAIVIKLQAPPVDGAANAALLRLVAERLGVPLSAVQLLRGHASRRKQIAVDGWTAAAVREALLADQPRLKAISREK